MIANDPDLWARLVTWALSPPNHGSFRSLLCLQQHIFTDNQGSYVSDEDARGLEFLRQIVEGHQHASANPELGSFRVRGTSGLSYFVTPGRGPHGSRFTVNPVESYDADAIPQMHRHHFARLNREGLCIVETPEMRRLVIGDAIGGIILALLDDLGSRHNIDTLDRHLRMRYDDPRVRLRRIADPLAGPPPEILAHRLQSDGQGGEIPQSAIGEQRCGRENQEVHRVLPQAMERSSEATARGADDLHRHASWR